MISTDLPKPWSLAIGDAKKILLLFNQHQAHALQIAADGEVVYPRLLIPKQQDLDREAQLYPSRATTQEQILQQALLKLAAKYPNPQVVTVSLFWGGLEGVKVKPLVTFSPKEIHKEGGTTHEPSHQRQKETQRSA